MTSKDSGETAGRGWTVVIPYFNEALYLPRTLQSLADQDVGPYHLVLVNNGSTDDSENICRGIMGRYPHIETAYVHEGKSGQIPALETGLKRVKTEFVTICDADTYYPPHYLALVRSLFLRHGSGAVAVIGHDLYSAPEGLRAKARLRYRQLITKILRKQCHSGGCCHSYRTRALRDSGGYSLDRWKYALYDHELMHRILKHGFSVYDYHLWCLPSERRRDPSAVRWTLAERLLYNVTWYSRKDWFFYRFLASRFERRGLYAIRIRDRTSSSLVTSSPDE